MVSLQEIRRVNGSTVHFVYFPEDMVASLGWFKGVDLDVCRTGSAVVVRRVL